MEPSFEYTPSPTPTSLHGSCLCQKVKYSSGTIPITLTICHCLECHKASASPFLMFGLYHNAALVWTAPPNGIRLVASDVAARGSCDSCGTSLFMKYHCRPDGTSVAVGSIDDDSLRESLPKLKEHIFLADKASWREVLADPEVARHDGFNGHFQRRLQDWYAKGQPLRGDIEVTPNQ